MMMIRLFVLLLLSGLTSTAKAAETEKVVAEFSGAGSFNTRPFTVTGPWEVQWTVSNGNRLFIEIKAANGANMVGAVDGPSGSSYEPMPGSFFLAVTEFEHETWTIKVLALPNH